MHPLEPLTEHEISTAIDIFRREGMFGPTVRLSLVALEEPDKVAVRDFDAGRRTDVDRQARVICFDLETKAVREVIVS